MEMINEVTTNLDRYRELIWHAAVPLDAEVSQSTSFRGAVEACEADEVTVMRVTSVEQTVRRTSLSCRTDPADMLKILVQRSGRSGVDQQGRRSFLTPHMLTVYDTARPYSVVQAADFVADAVLVPRSRLPIGDAAVDALQRHPLSTGRGPGALFTAYLAELRQRIGECSPEGASRCMTLLLELLEAALAEQPPVTRSGPAARYSILRWITRHLGDEDLSPTTIAAANGISVRYLHRLFEDSGASVSAYIRSERLRRIRQDLTDRTYEHRTIAAIGARWGFPDPAQLSRSFRAEFGLTPTNVRGRALDSTAA